MYVHVPSTLRLDSPRRAIAQSVSTVDATFYKAYGIVALTVLIGAWVPTFWLLSLAFMYLLVSKREKICHDYSHTFNWRSYLREVAEQAELQDVFWCCANDSYIKYDTSSAAIRVRSDWRFKIRIVVKDESTSSIYVRVPDGPVMWYTYCFASHEDFAEWACRLRARNQKTE